MPNLSLFLEGQQCYYVTYSRMDKGIHTFPKGNCTKENIIAQMELELVL